MLKGREGNRGATPSTDLLVCFPSRAHLSLMPKPICSPARPSEPNKGHQHPHHRRNRSVSRRVGGPGGQASPMLWNKTKSMGSEISEPTSPKVTCAGQIKVRPRSSGCRSWQSVMEEIEKIHNDKKQKKRLNWAESLGFKKEVMQFLTCLRTIRFDLRCFGSFSGTDVVSDEEEDEEDEEEEGEVYRENENHVNVEENENEGSKTVFSKWFMVLQEDQNKEREEENGNEKGEEESAAPPPNALLLMRCRSAPAKSWLSENEIGGGDDEKEEEYSRKEKEKEKETEKGLVKRSSGQSLKSLMEEDKMVVNVMRCHSDYCGISTDIATETWIVDGNGIRDLMSRSRSWKR